MKKFILILTLIVVALLQGCARTDSVIKTELEAEIIELKSELDNSKLMLKKLEREITDLKKQIQVSSGTEKDTFKELKLVKVNEERAFYTIDDSSFNQQCISIIGSNAEGLVESYERVRVNGSGSGETIGIQVIGSIYNFQLVEIKYDNEGKFTESKVLYASEEVRNQLIVIETRLPEGIPVEKIKWTDDKGDIHEVILSYDGYGFNGSIIWSK